MNYYKGNYETDSIDHNGWFVGAFMDEGDLRKTGKVEIKYYEGVIAGHQTKVSNILECTLVLRGSMNGLIDNKTITLKAGEYVVIPPGIQNNLCQATSDDLKAITIKAPSDPSAKKIIEEQTMEKAKYANLMLFNGNKVLMQLRDNKPDIVFPGKWAVPGGKIEDYESSKECIQREFEEETGYKAAEIIFADSTIYTFMDDKPKIDFFYAFYDRKQQIQCFEGQKMEFIPIDELDNLDAFAEQIPIVKQAYSNIISKN